MSFINKAQASMDITTSTVVNSPIFSNNMEFWDFVLLVISIFVLSAWILSIVFVLYWWLLLILSWWKEEKIKPAVNTIRYAVFWLIITVASIFLFPILGKLLWIDVERYAKPSRILEKIEQIWTNIFGSNSYDTSNIINSSPEEIPADFSDL